MFHIKFEKGVFAFIGMSLLLAMNVHAYNKADLDAAERGILGRKLMKDFIDLYKGDAGQLANRKDLLYISYEILRKIESVDDSLFNQLKVIDQKITRIQASGTRGKGSSPSSAEIEALSQKVEMLNQQLNRLIAPGPDGKPPIVSSPGVEKEVKSLLPTLLQQDPQIKKLENEITALKKDQKREDRGGDRNLNSQVHTARLIAGTSIAVTLFTVLFMAR